MTKFITASIFIVVTPALLNSCGGSTQVTSKNERSVGQQLTDLNHAHMQGIISAKEYDKLKRAIIRDND